MFVRRVHEHAGLASHRRADRPCEIALDAGQNRDIVCRNAPVDAVWIHALLAMMKHTDFEACFVLPLWNSVEVSVLWAIQDEDRKAGGGELGASWGKPADNLPLGDGQGLERLAKFSRPGSGGQHQRAGLVAPAL